MSSWKVQSRDEKFNLYKTCLDPLCIYTDPLGQVKGWDELVNTMLDFHQQIPGGHFATTWFLAHHDRCIAKWQMLNTEGNMLSEGISYGEFNSQGKLSSMTGFFELQL